MSINKMKKTKIKISGMHCVSCAMSIEWALEDVPGVKNSKVNFAKQIAEVEHDEEAMAEQLLSAISKAGYSGKIED